MNGLSRLSLLLLVSYLTSITLAADETRTFVAPDDSIEVTAGSTWKDISQAEGDCTLEITDANDQLFIQGNAVLQTDFASDLKGFAQMALGRFARTTTGATMSEPKEIQIKGNKAIEWEVRFTAPDHFRYAGIVICTETPRYFAEIRAVTYDSKIKDSLAELRDLAATVSEAPDRPVQHNDLAAKSGLESTATANDTARVFCASDDSIEITAGATWKDYVGNSQGTTLHIADGMVQQFIQGAAILRSDYASDLNGFAQMEAERIAQAFPGATASAPKKIKINGNEAIQWEVHWTDPDHFRWASLVTCISTHRYFTEVQASAYESKIRDRLPELRDFVATVRDAPGQPTELVNSTTQPAR